jgi:putative PIN family toxin of toxin-antitoxin system
MRIVLDTNVLVSGLIRADGPPGRIVDLLRAGRLTLVVDDRILAEYADVLSRPPMRRYFTAADAANVLEFFRHGSEPVVCGHVVLSLPDPGDVPFLEAALAAGVPLVTGNERHFPLNRRRGARLLSPRALLERLAE